MQKEPCILSHQNSSTYRSPQYALRICGFSSAPWVLSRLSCSEHSLLLNSLSFFELSELRTFRAASAIILPNTLLTSFYIVQLLAIWRILFSMWPLVQALGSCLAFEAPWSLAGPPIYTRGLVATTLMGIWVIYFGMVPISFVE